MDRRRFVHTVAGLAAGAAIVSAGDAVSGSGARRELPARRLGRTGLDVPILGLGGHHVGLSGSERKARALVEAALEQGIRFFDTAESYQRGKSERWIGAALEGVRREVLLMTKTYAPRQRSAQSARRHLEGSLSRLRTDYLDLWQLHSMQSIRDVDRAFRPGGAMEYILEAQAEGLVRHVGVTGHVMPAVHRRALEYWDRGFQFDTVQLPINPIDYHQQSFQQEVLSDLVERDIGVIAMKTSADGALLRERLCTIDECLRYVWSLPVAVAVVGMEAAAQVGRNAASARRFIPMTDGEMQALRNRLRPHANPSLEWYKRG